MPPSRIAEETSKAQTTELQRVSVSPDPMIRAFQARIDFLCRLAESGNPLAFRLIHNAYDLLVHGIAHASEIALVAQALDDKSKT